ncbi:MAG: hypothetical protein ACOX74_01255 [Lachnospiraceae bacterium]|jgi:hypothetical protein
MLHYNIDNEILDEMYHIFISMNQDDYDGLHEFGKKYLPLLDEYALEDRTVFVIRHLSEFRTKQDLEETATKLLHGHVTANVARKEEKKGYDLLFEGADDITALALRCLWDSVLEHRIIPYKIKNREFHIDVIDTPAMNLSLDFEDVLIEDGRNPRQIRMDHISGDKFTTQVRVTGTDGSVSKVDVPRYRVEFINGLTAGRKLYDRKVSSFSFSHVQGTLKTYNYANNYTVDPEMQDKLAWRLLMQPLEAVTMKAEVLGYEDLTREEQTYMPLFCVMYELVGFYLRDDSVPGIGRRLASFSDEAAAGFRFSQSDLDVSAAIFRRNGLTQFADRLETAITDRAAFCRYFIQYAAMKQSEELYHTIEGILTDCGSAYRTKPYSLAFRKFHKVVRNALNDYFATKGWKGSFPCYYAETSPDFLEVSTVYSKMYTYLNEKRKGFYFDFIESSQPGRYLITPVGASILLHSREDAGSMQALSACFLDGGRRRAQIAGQIEITDEMETEEVTEGVLAMADALFNAD